MTPMLEALTKPASAKPETEVSKPTMQTDCFNGAGLEEIGSTLKCDPEVALGLGVGSCGFGMVF